MAWSYNITKGGLPITPLNNLSYTIMIWIFRVNKCQPYIRNLTDGGIRYHTICWRDCRRDTVIVFILAYLAMVQEAFLRFEWLPNELTVLPVGHRLLRLYHMRVYNYGRSTAENCYLTIIYRNHRLEPLTTLRPGKWDDNPEPVRFDPANPNNHRVSFIFKERSKRHIKTWRIVCNTIIHLIKHILTLLIQ